MRRRTAKHGHWLCVLLCLGVAFLPLGVRERARAGLLDLHGRIAALTAGEPAAGSAEPASDRVRLLEAEVLRLRRALETAGAAREVVRPGSRAQLIPAEVLPLARAADLVQRVVLGRGSEDGVRRGLPVLANGVLIGRVAEVTPSTCEVRLVTDPRFRIRATIPRPGQDVEGMLSGDGSGWLVFEPALLDETASPPVLKPGETVLCSRASVLCGIPALLGVVEGAEQEAGEGLRGQDLDLGLGRARIRPALERDPRRVVIVRVSQDGKA